MTTYYVNSSTGSDKFAGTSASKPLASLDAVNALKLKPGDVVLFSSGTEYHGQLNVKYSGSVDKPITFGSYGSGEPPVISGGSVGIYGSKASNIVVKDIAIEKTTGNAIYAGSASNWTIDNIKVSDTGSSSKAGSISFQSSSNIKITDSDISGTHGDGVWMLNVKGAVLTGNKVADAKGHNADAIQLNGSSNIVVKDNHLSMTGDTGSAKGVLVLVDAKNALVDGNTIIGGGFGVSAMGQNVTITNNDISGYKGYSWSYGIGLGQQVDAKNYLISNNHIHDGVWGVSVSASGTDSLTRTNINITGNSFDDLSSAALKVDRPATGVFQGNTVTDTVAKDAYLSNPVKGAGTFITNPSSVLVPQKAAPVPVLDKAPLITLPSNIELAETPSKVVPRTDELKLVKEVLKFDNASQLSISGNVLDNDHSGNDILTLRNLNGTAFKTNPTMNIEGKYGLLHIESDGDFTFTVNSDRIAQSTGTLTENFQYKVSNGAQVEASYISIVIDADHIAHSISADHFV